MGPDAVEQTNVGVGALAGSTIMLLTMPWFISIYFGRVDTEIIDDDSDNYWLYKTDNRLKNKCGFTTSAVKITKQIKKMGLVMLLTMISYVIVQSVSFLNITKGPEHRTIFWPALISFITS